MTYFLDICCSRVLRSLISDSCLARTSTKTSRSSDNLVQEIVSYITGNFKSGQVYRFFKILSIYLVSTCPRSCVVCCSVWDWIVDVFRRDSNYKHNKNHVISYQLMLYTILKLIYYIKRKKKIMNLSEALNNLSNYSFEYISLHCHKSYTFFATEFKNRL